MSLQIDGYTPSAQTAVTNPYQQQQDTVRQAGKQNNTDKNKTATKPQGTAAAQTQQTDTKQTKNKTQVAENQGQHANSNTSHTTQQRGSIVNVTA